MLKDIILYHSGHFSMDCKCSFCINKTSIYKSLIKLGYNVAILSFNCDWDYFYPAKVHFDYALLYQNKMFGQFMFEANKMPKKVIEFANTYFDYIICGSNFLVDTWKNSGIDNKFLIPSCLGLNTKIFNTLPTKLKYYPIKFKFLIVGNWQHRPEWEDRKGMSIAINCFTELFAGNKNVILIVKTDSCAPNNFNLDNIIVIKESLSDLEMANLYRSCANNGAYISLHKGEGFGKQAQEALCCGCNIGATNFSGVKTFLNNTNSTLFNYKLVDWHIYLKEFYLDNKYPKFALVNMDEVKKWMAAVANKQFKKLLIDASQYSWDVIVKELITKIKEKI